MQALPPRARLEPPEGEFQAQKASDSIRIAGPAAVARTVLLIPRGKAISGQADMCHSSSGQTIFAPWASSGRIRTSHRSNHLLRPVFDLKPGYRFSSFEICSPRRCSLPSSRTNPRAARAASRVRVARGVRPIFWAISCVASPSAVRIRPTIAATAGCHQPWVLGVPGIRSEAAASANRAL